MPSTVCQLCGADIPDGVQSCSACEVTSARDVPAAFRFTTGETIDGRYEVIHRIPGGGMGELYKVRHLHLHDVRAIKILRSDQLGDDNYRKRFVREARLAASIKHPNVALLHDFAMLPDKSWYMVEEFIDGTTLARSLRAGRRFSLDEIVEIGRQVLLGLGAIHDGGIIHRDISPDNIMLANSRSGAIRVKIIDLGIARSIDPSDAHSLTSAGLFIGKPHYASPEQMRLIEDDTPIDHRTDLYSLGVVLYEVVSGKVPFEASNPFEYLMKQLSGELPAVDRTFSDKVPPDLERFIVKLLSAKREDRFPSTVEALLALSKIRVGKPTLVQDTPVPGGEAPFPLSRPSTKRHRTAEVPIEQLQRLIEQDRPDSVRVPVIPDPRQRPEPEEPPTEIDELDDSRKVTVVQLNPVLPTQDVPKPRVNDDETERTPLPVAPDEEPVAFMPDIPREVVSAPSTPPHGAFDVNEPDVSVRPRRSGQNPIIWFVAGIIFVAVVSVGGYLFYRWLDARFGEEGEVPAGIASSATEETAPVLERIATAADDEGASESGEAPIEEDPSGKPPTQEPATAVRSEPPPDRTPSPRDPAPPTRPPPSPVTPAPSSRTTEAPPVEAAPTEEPNASATSAESDSVEEAGNAPVVLPGSTDDVREGDLVAPGPGVIPPGVVRTVEPIYPPLSSNMRSEGFAMFSILVGPDGKAEIVKLIVSSGSEPLDESAEDAARQTVFSPATKNGVKVRMWKTLRFEFKKTKGF